MILLPHRSHKYILLTLQTPKKTIKPAGFDQVRAGHIGSIVSATGLISDGHIGAAIITNSKRVRKMDNWTRPKPITLHYTVQH